MTPLVVASYVLVPALAKLLCQRSRIAALAGPCVICYAVGLVLANLIAIDTALAQRVAGLSVVLALPLLLAAANIRAWLRLSRVTVIASLLAFGSVVTVTLIVALVWRGQNAWRIAGMLVGVYTGGTPNLAAIGAALGVAPELFLRVHTADVVVCGIYLLFLLTLGGRVFGRVLRPFGQRSPARSQTAAEPPWQWRNAPRALGVGVALCAGGAAPALFVAQTAQEVVALVGVTTAGVLASTVRQVRRLPGLYETGDYVLLVFCVAVASMASLRGVVVGGGAVLLVTTTVVLGSVLMHTALCAWVGIDRDTYIITSAAAIYGPAFIGPVAQRLNNREVVVSGVAAGLAGLALGNYLGLAVAYLLRAVG